jgi:predicted SPOUT superfamily RNA methylase MTH1
MPGAETSMTRLWIAIPSSLLEDTRTKREQTIKIGLVARAAAIFRVEKIFVFLDPQYSRPQVAEFIRKVLNYMATPPYLRKKLYPISEDLEEVGVLPPLAIPSHRRPPRLTPGEVREAVLEIVRGRLYADAGVGRLLEYSGSGQAGARVTVVVKKRNGDYYCEQTRPPEDEYWGYEAKTVDSLPKLVKSSKPLATILTSRWGENVVDDWEALEDIMSSSGPVLVAFGGPRRGLLDMYGRKTIENMKARVYNFIPSQGVETVRTEEAIYATLAILNAAMFLARRRSVK